METLSALHCSYRYSYSYSYRKSRPCETSAVAPSPYSIVGQLRFLSAPRRLSVVACRNEQPHLPLHYIATFGLGLGLGYSEPTRAP